MRKSYLFWGGSLLVLLGVTTLIWLWAPASTSSISVYSMVTPMRSGSGSFAAGYTPPYPPPAARTTPSTNPPLHKFKSHYPLTPDEQAMMNWRAEQLAKDPAFDWKTSIKFDGLVLDENNQPLPGAQVKWNTTTAQGNGNGETVSGADGRFFIGTSGKVMLVSVTKEGYRTLPKPYDFEFSAFYQDNYYDNDKEHPATFHLRKIPPAEPIYITHGGGQNDLVGDQISIKTRSSGVVHGEQLEGMWIQFVQGPQNGPGREQYKIILGTSQGGGVILATEDADEMAPQSGYQTPLDTQIIADYIGHRFISVKAFFKDGAGHFGSVTFDIELGGHNLVLRYFLKYNPSSGRSLSATQGSDLQLNK